MRKVVVVVLIVFGVLALLGIVLFAGVGLLATMSKPGVPREVILEANFEHGVHEALPDDPFAQFMLKNEMQIRDVVEALERGAEDRRVKAFVAKVGGENMNMAHAQEIRDAVMRFRKAGKLAVAYAETFGEFGPGNTGYYLATAFDKIYLQPSGDIGFTGLRYDALFLRGLYDKLDIKLELSQRYEYKNAVNSYTKTGFTEAHREALERVMDSRFEQIVAGVAQGRSMTEEQVLQLADRGPYLAAEAKDAGLVDDLFYRDQVMDSLREGSRSGAELLYLGRYLDRAGRPHRHGTTVALIHGFGQVVRGPSGYSPLTGTSSMGSDTVAAAIRAAVRDSRVEGILFRVDSPGGSYVASDTIWHEIARAREAGKPVVVSMGNVAGSGGYFVAMNADRIVAEPSTITGSIGVFGGKMVTEGMWKKIGVTFDGVQTSANGTQWSPFKPYTAFGRQRLEDSLDRIYEDFTGKVAEGRNLPLDEVLGIARGRIWTGADALELGLVDALGGYHEALGSLRELLGLKPDAPIRLKTFPRPRSPLDALFGEQANNSERVAVERWTAGVRRIQEQLRILQQAGLLDEPGVLTVAPEAAFFE